VDIRSTSPSTGWRALYEAAILEVDCTRLPERIVEAEKAITDRLRELSTFVNCAADIAEGAALRDTLTVLRDLCKLEQVDVKFPHCA
jgi:hypothetical protein